MRANPRWRLFRRNEFTKKMSCKIRGKRRWHCITDLNKPVIERPLEHECWREPLQ